MMVRHGPVRPVLALCFLLAVSLAGNLAAMAAEPRELLVSAAASLRNVLETIGRNFGEKNPGAKVVFNFGASGALLEQISAGAPVDLFFAADIGDVRKLEAKGLLASGSPRPFVGNELVFVAPGTSGLAAAGIADLAKGEWGKIAIGNPKTVPAGRYAEQAIAAEKVAEALKERLILCENVRQVLDYVIRGEVQGGFVYQTDARTAKPGELKQVFSVPSDRHAPIIYGYGKLGATRNGDLADRFLTFLVASESRDVLKNAGFLAAR